MTGLIDEKSAAKAGNLLGADIIVIGSVSELGNYYNLNVRLIEIETGKSDVIGNIEKYLKAGFEKVVVVAVDGLVKKKLDEKFRQDGIRVVVVSGGELRLLKD